MTTARTYDAPVQGYSLLCFVVISQNVVVMPHHLRLFVHTHWALVASHGPAGTAAPWVCPCPMNYSPAAMLKSTSSGSISGLHVGCGNAGCGPFCYFSRFSVFFFRVPAMDHMYTDGDVVTVGDTSRRYRARTRGPSKSGSCVRAAVNANTLLLLLTAGVYKYKICPVMGCS